MVINIANFAAATRMKLAATGWFTVGTQLAVAVRELKLAASGSCHRPNEFRVAHASPVLLIDLAALTDKRWDIQVVLLDGAPDGLSHGC
jgi:hypothetical protein